MAKLPARPVARAARQPRGQRLLPRVVGALLLAGFLPLVVASFGLVEVNRDAMFEQVQRTHALAASTAAARVESFLDARRTLAEGLAADPAIGDPSAPAAQAALGRALAAGGHLGLLSLALLDGEGHEAMRAQLREARGRPALAALLAAGTAHEIEGAKDDGGLAVRLALPLAGRRGWLLLIADGGALAEALRPTELGREAYLVLLDRQLQPIGGTQAGGDALDLPADLLSQVQKGQVSGAGRYRDPQGREILAAYSGVPRAGWTVISQQPSRIAERVAREMRRRSFWAIGLAALLTVALSSGAYLGVVRPLRRLATAQRRLAGRAAAPEGAGEIALLESSFAALERSMNDRAALDQVFLGRYQVLEPIGSGGMASVFRGWDPKLERPVALKTLLLGEEAATRDAERLKSEARSLLREAVTSARLQHPNVVAIYDVEDSPSRAYIAMELVEGANLEALLWQRGSLVLAEAVPIGAAIARGLAHAHAHGVVHRDLKPANVLLGRDGAIKVTDFGIAAVLTSTSGPSRGVFGTPGYIPPEVLVGEPFLPVGDLYSLGVVLYYSLAGALPFTGRGPREIRQATLVGELKPLERAVSGVPEELARLVNDLLDRDPGRRPASTEAVAEVLGHFAAEHSWLWAYPLDAGAPSDGRATDGRAQWLDTSPWPKQ